jgi:hypothetical protein
VAGGGGEDRLELGLAEGRRSLGRDEDLAEVGMSRPALDLADGALRIVG